MAVAIDDALIAEAGRRLAAAAPDAQVILFGSHARGEAGPHSDADFLVIEPEVDDLPPLAAGVSSRPPHSQPLPPLPPLGEVQ